MAIIRVLNFNLHSYLLLSNPSWSAHLHCPQSPLLILNAPSTAIDPDQDIFIVHIPLYSCSLLMTQQPILLRMPPFPAFPLIPGLEIFWTLLSEDKRYDFLSNTTVVDLSHGSHKQLYKTGTRKRKTTKAQSPSPSPWWWCALILFLLTTTTCHCTQPLSNDNDNAPLPLPLPCQQWWQHATSITLALSLTTMWKWWCALALSTTNNGEVPSLSLSPTTTMVMMLCSHNHLCPQPQPDNNVPLPSQQHENDDAPSPSPSRQRWWHALAFPPCDDAMMQWRQHNEDGCALAPSLTTMRPGRPPHTSLHMRASMFTHTDPPSASVCALAGICSLPEATIQFLSTVQASTQKPSECWC